MAGVGFSSLLPFILFSVLMPQQFTTCLCVVVVVFVVVVFISVRALLIFCLWICRRSHFGAVLYCYTTHWRHGALYCFS